MSSGSTPAVRKSLPRLPRRFSFRAVTSAAAVASFVAGLGPNLSAGAETAPGDTVTGGTIVLGQYADQSGANAPTGASKYGLDAYLQTVNAAGGIQGKKLQLISYDDGYKPAQTAQLVRKLVFSDQAFAIVGGVGTPTTAAIASTLDALGVRLVAMSTGSPIFYAPVRKYVFPAWPLYTTDGKTMGTFVKARFAGKKTGVIYQDDGFGKPILAADQSVLGDVETASYTPGQVDFSDALVKFKAAAVEVIVLAAIAVPAAQILKGPLKIKRRNSTCRVNRRTRFRPYLSRDENDRGSGFGCGQGVENEAKETARNAFYGGKTPGHSRRPFATGGLRPGLDGRPNDCASRRAGARSHQELASGANTARPVLAEALAALKSGDTLVVWRLDRLGRSSGHLIEVATALASRKGRSRRAQIKRRLPGVTWPPRRSVGPALSDERTR